jgi:hypothetical protein
VPIAVTCPTCHARTKAPDAAAGRKAKCPKCGSTVPVPVPEDLPEEKDDRTPPAGPSPRRSRKKLLITAGIVVLALILLGGGSFLVWNTVAESRRQAKAEEAIRTALDQWCSSEPLDKLRVTNSEDYFDEIRLRLSTDPRPTGYQITGITREGRRRGYSTYHVSVTLTFPGGPETRLYNVGLNEKSGTYFITTKASEDISGTESHARSILRAWLDSWVAGEDMATFKKKHPEAAAKMTMDITWASLSAAGKRLVSYDITNVTPAPGPSGGFRFTVTAIIEAQGKPETKILRYDVFKDRMLSEGRWTVMGM